MNHIRSIKNLLEEYEYTDYEIKVLKYVLTTLIMESSKLIIFVFFWSFHKKVEELLWAMVIFFSLRISSGGIHYKKYITCLSVSFLYFVFCVNILPLLYVSKLLKLVILSFCIVSAYHCTPIVSKYRSTPSEEKVKACKREITFLLVLYFAVMCIMPEGKLLDIGFWCIVLHVVQLGYAFQRVERRKKNE